MGFFSNIKNRARATNKNDLKRIFIPASGKPVRSSPVMPIAPVRQDTRVPLIPGMNPQVPVGLPDANGYYPGDDRYGGGFTRGPSSPPPRQTLEELLASPTVRPGLLSRAPKKRGGLGGLLRRLQEQIKNQRGGNLGSDFRAPRMPRIDDGRMRAMPIGLGDRLIDDGRMQMPIGSGDRLQMPQQNLDFLSRLPKIMMPNLDFSNLPQMAGNPNIPAPDGYELREDDKGMNYFREQLSPEDQAQNMLPRRLDVPSQDFNLQNIRPGYAVGGPLMGRAAAQAAKNKRIKGMADDIFGTDQQIMNIGRGQPGGLTYGARDLNRIRNTENLIMGGTGAGLAIGLDGTQELREPFSKDNLMFISPEAFGRDLAQLRMDVGSVVNLAKNKANEVGANINEYVGRARSAYDQEMENQRMQELDAEQGMQPFSALLGPDMPLRRPELTEGRTTSDIDDILSSLEKKN